MDSLAEMSEIAEQLADGIMLHNDQRRSTLSAQLTVLPESNEITTISGISFREVSDGCIDFLFRICSISLVSEWKVYFNSTSLAKGSTRMFNRDL